MSKQLFSFKQFEIDQTHCAMKVNTDGVLLAAWAGSGGSIKNTTSTAILDIGTGTGVIALMLAQRFHEAEIDAVEIDKLAATTAAVNFQASAFAGRLKAFPLNIEHYFMVYPEQQFDLIVSNPPFFIDSLKSENQAKQTARHTDTYFFDLLCQLAAKHLKPDGRFCVILPLDTAAILLQFAQKFGLYPSEILNVSSFPDCKPHRQLLSLSFQPQEVRYSSLSIYEAEKVYHPAYRALLQNFLTIF